VLTTAWCTRSKGSPTPVGSFCVLSHDALRITVEKSGFRVLLGVHFHFYMDYILLSFSEVSIGGDRVEHYGEGAFLLSWEEVHGRRDGLDAVVHRLEAVVVIFPVEVAGRIFLLILEQPFVVGFDQEVVLREVEVRDVEALDWIVHPPPEPGDEVVYLPFVWLDVLCGVEAYQGHVVHPLLFAPVHGACGLALLA